MKTPQAIYQQLEQLEELQKNLNVQQQRAQHAQENVRKQQDALRTATTMLADPDKRTWSLEQLDAHRRELSAQIQRARENLAGSAPSDKVRELKARVESLEAREQQLSLAAEQIRRLESLAERAHAIRELVRLKDQIIHIQNDLNVLEQTAPKLMQAYSQLEQVQTLIAERQRERSAVADKARELGRALPAGKPDEWAKLALLDIRKLSAVLGKSQSRLSTLVDKLCDEAHRLSNQVAVQEKKLISAQQEIEQVRTQVETQRKHLQNQEEEISEWAVELEQLGYDNLDPTSDDALKVFRKQLHAKRTALEWFRTNTTFSQRG